MKRTSVLVLSFGMALGATAESLSSVHPDLTALLDTGNLVESFTTFRVQYLHAASDPDSFLNAVRFVPGASWHTDLDLEVAEDTLHGMDGPLQLGTRIAGDYANDFPVAFRSGEVSPSVPVGRYGFALEFLGGADPTADGVLASIPMVLEVAERLDAAATGRITPGAIGPGESATVWMSVENRGRRTIYNSGWYQGGVPAGVTDAVYGQMQVDFDDTASWVHGRPIFAGEAESSAHSRLTARAGTPAGAYRMYGGWIGGYRIGDQHYLPMDPVPQVEVVPEPASLLALGLGLVALSRRRIR